MLRWARETAGLSLEDVAKLLNRKRITVQTIKLWETGSEHPTYLQLERLAYEVYKRPIAVFFFPEPPEEPTPKQSFRTLPMSEIEKMAPRMHYLIRKGRVFQLNLIELYEGKSPVRRRIVKDLGFRPSESIESMVNTTRKYLGITVKNQESWKTSDAAFKHWRSALEGVGVHVFKDAFRVSEFSGFCLYDEVFPLIYVNNSSTDNRQIFTLFHELAHLLFHTGGVDTRLDSYISRLRGDDREIEIKCNAFAGLFLVPRADFLMQISDSKISETLIEKLARRYLVSREVILTRCREEGLVSQKYYSEMMNTWRMQPIPDRGGGGNYYRNIGVYLGRQYLELVFGRYHQGRITSTQLADYLGVKDSLVAGVESILMG